VPGTAMRTDGNESRGVSWKTEVPHS
jgi:hypothetical protein